MMSPYFFAHSVYVSQGYSNGISRRFPTTGRRFGPGGYGKRLELEATFHLYDRNRCTKMRTETVKSTACSSCESGMTSIPRASTVLQAPEQLKNGYIRTVALKDHIILSSHRSWDPTVTHARRQSRSKGVSRGRNS